ncbi:MAG TPA: Rpn family recombination-promoting nuclease/putative transposase [Kofleriaceae bacterium]|jgi:predicted transposase/invertase (TIGR01784 family)
MLPNPHDALFKAVLGKPEHARGALQAVVPGAFAEALDWSTLAHCPGSFVDRVLRERHTDLLFSVGWRGGGEAFVYLLFEHQSTCDDRMPFRLLRYLVRIWEDWAAEHPRWKVLPLIIPVVLYHGDASWSAPLSFDALFDVPDSVRPAVESHLVRFAYRIDDLSQIPDDQLRARAMTALAKLVVVSFKYARTRTDLLDILSEWADVMRQVARAPDGLEALALVMRYILMVNDHVEPEALQALLEREVGPEAKDTIMTAGERLVEQGIQQGIQQRIQRERTILLRLLRQRFGDDVTADVEHRLAMASVDQVDAWTERVLAATERGLVDATLADLLSG